ncbi:hypothetical protein P691DRAFT_790721 [Macrolepiota fuliginosa MF-IS2]|uniref:Uncharacterized protein n=1 Tax=Macrolepiota fuliginosa MF-IS2 TaxID=1400762 RepID=A0A9P5X1P5_9AGAR|nr:hypothetical protein P691DRAFT_790721 [Macrolepiota fuliginosa MF-IS2]
MYNRENNGNLGEDEGEDKDEEGCKELHVEVIMLLGYFWPDGVIAGFTCVLQAKSTVNAPTWWCVAYTNLVYHLLLCLMYNFKEWGQIREIVWQHEASVSPRQQVEADWSMRKHMWATVNSQKSVPIINSMAFAQWEIKSDISPPQITTEGGTLAGARWSLELLLDEAKSRLCRAVTLRWMMDDECNCKYVAICLYKKYGQDKTKGNTHLRDKVWKITNLGPSVLITTWKGRAESSAKKSFRKALSGVGNHDELLRSPKRFMTYLSASSFRTLPPLALRSCNWGAAAWSPGNVGHRHEDLQECLARDCGGQMPCNRILTPSAPPLLLGSHGCRCAKYTEASRGFLGCAF